MKITLPPYIALCGNPYAGKSTVERILIQDYGMMPGGDGDCLRYAAMPLFGLSHDDVFTQAGKARRTIINGAEYENRELLGLVGKLMERQFGTDFIPEANLRNLPEAQRLLVNDGGTVVFASCRMTQAAVYKRAGGVCIGIENPNTQPSPYDFDQFDPALVDVWLVNDGHDLMALRRAVAVALEHFVTCKRLAA